MTSRIDTLRQMVAAIGQTQIEYHRFFPSFADQLAQGLGQFLGDPSSVALCPADGDFAFDVQYGHEGLGFEGGKYRIPLMLRLKNLQDEGELVIRIRLYFVKSERALLAWVGDGQPVTVEASNLTQLFEAVYEHLTDLLSSSAWFEDNPAHYQGTRIGFSAGGKGAV